LSRNFVEKINNLSVTNKVLLGQLLIVVLMMVGFLLLASQLSAKSALYGGLAALIPNIYFARKINKHKGQEARIIVRSFYAGESGKLIITVLCFAAVFQDPNIDFRALIVTYLAALTVFWFALLIRKY